VTFSVAAKCVSHSATIAVNRHGWRYLTLANVVARHKSFGYGAPSYKFESALNFLAELPVNIHTPEAALMERVNAKLPVNIHTPEATLMERVNVKWHDTQFEKCLT